MGPPPPRQDSSNHPPIPVTLAQLLTAHSNDSHAALSTLLSRHNDLLIAHASLQNQLASASRQLDRSAQENDRLWKSLKASPRPGATRQNSDAAGSASGGSGAGERARSGAHHNGSRKPSDGVSPGLGRLEVGGLGSSLNAGAEDRLGSPAGFSSPGSGYRYQTPPPPASASSAAASPVLHNREQSSSSLQKSSSVDFGKMGDQELLAPSHFVPDDQPRTPGRDSRAATDPNLLSVGGNQFRSSSSMPSMVLPPDHPTTPTERRFLPQIAPVSPLYSDHQPRGSSAASSPAGSPAFPLTPNQAYYSSDSQQLHPTAADHLRRARSPSSNSDHGGATPYGSSGPSASSPTSPGALASPAVIVPPYAASSEPSPSYSAASDEKRPSAPGLAPHLLEYTKVHVGSSNIKVNDRGKEVISFIVDVTINLPPGVDPNQPNGATSKWKVEKMYSDILLLDSAVKSKTSRQETKSIGSLPDKSLFKDHAPHKSDQRKAVLEKYLQTLLSIQLRDRRSLVDFFNSGLYVPDADSADSHEPMSGWLTKRGRAFQGWQTRYYRLEPGVALVYYDTKDGNKLGEISLVSAAIGRQAARPADAGDDAYLHAFLIRTMNESSADTDHILCAENDEARDGWVQALTAPVMQPPPPPSTPGSGKGGMTGGKASGSLDESRRPTNGLDKSGLHHKGSAELAGSSSAPSGLDYFARAEGKRAPSEQSYNSDLRVPNSASSAGHGKPQSSPSAPRRTSNQADRERPMSPEKDRRERQDSAGSGLGPNRFLASNVSGPMNAVPLPSGYEFKKAERQKKTKSSFWNFSGKSSGANDKVAAALQAAATAQAAVPSRPVFGVPLKEAVQISRIRPGLELPAVVYRCVEYLEAKNAEAEEGIFRLSGSANVIRMLKDRFNAEGDVNLLTSNEYYDPHAVAGLLKLFLRELPVHILTRELHAEFLQVIDLRNRKDRVNALGRLVARLPIEEYTLFRFFFAHLCLIAQNAEVTKMNLRNLGIVFSVNLSIPAPLFTLLLTEFDLVFAVEEQTGGARPIMVGENGEEIPMGEEYVRRPEADGVGEEGPRGEVKGRNRNSILYEQSGANVLMERQEGEMNTLREQADNDSDEDNGSLASDLIDDHYSSHPGSPEVSFRSHQNPQHAPHTPQPPHQRQLSENEVISFGGGYSQSADGHNLSGYAHGEVDGYRAPQRSQTSPVQSRFQGAGGLPSSPRVGGFGFGEARR